MYPLLYEYNVLEESNWYKLVFVCKVLSVRLKVFRPQLPVNVAKFDKASLDTYDQ